MSKQTEIWREARRLHRLGFAIHWLFPKQKRPVESGWTTGPRKEWEYLRDTYQTGFNVGTRLGSPSKIDGKCLCVIDVDVKSTAKHHRAEAVAALKQLIGKAQCPEVRTGRGNGSRHCYCVTPAPFKTFNPFQSEETVKVMMPSKSPSKREREELTEKEIKDGWRISVAWEISLYSDGRQVVLPPSIHPDTNAPYFWKTPMTAASDLPLIEFSIPQGAEAETASFKSPGARGPQETVEDFEIDESLDVRWLPDVPAVTRALITKGLWKGRIIDDRSAMLIPAVNGLISAGLDKNGVLTVLTDRTTFLGECAFDHAKTKSRKRAAQWLWNYTVKDIVAGRDPRRAFGGKPIEHCETLDEKRAGKQAQEIEADGDWKQYLEQTDKGMYRSTYNNCKTILMNVCGHKNFVGRNEFAANDYFLSSTPWGSRKGDAVVDIDIIRIKDYCCEQFRIEFSNNIIDEALRYVADINRFHPVKEWIKSLDWDGKPRIETWLRDFASATGPDQYLRAVSRKVLTAMVKRVFEPGCKFDHVLILEGLQGSGKSTLLSNLAAPWFSDETLNIGDKDAVLTMQSKWLIELGELSVMARAEVESLKAFITRRTDRIRAPYGKRVEEFPRQCIFIGSTNRDEYLRDETGNRRFWPVKCGAINFEALIEARGQLFAEAYGYYALKEPLYLEDKELESLARIEQEKRGEVDEWLSTIRDLVCAEAFPVKSFEMREVSKSMEEFGAQRLTPWDQKRIAKCLRFLGFEKFQEPKGPRRKLWRATTAFRTAEQANGTATNRSQGSSKTPLPVAFF